MSLRSVEPSADLVEETLTFGRETISLLRPADSEALIDFEEFANDEFLPYCAELWPSALGLAQALPARMDGVRVIEVGAGLGVPSLVAAARGARVTAFDWAADAAALLERNAARNGVEVDVVTADWRAFSGACDLVLAADLLYEERNIGPLAALFERLGAEVLLAEPGRPHAPGLFRKLGEAWTCTAVAPRVVRLRRTEPIRLR